MKTFCPNCEKETNCVYIAELYECKECGEDFAKYIVSRKPAESDVSMTGDVLTDIKSSNSAESNDCGKSLSGALMKNVELRARLDMCESALISMVCQFFYSAEGSNCFSHAFMSAEEEAAAYLVGNGIAFWNDEGHSQICFTEVDDARRPESR